MKGGKKLNSRLTFLGKSPQVQKRSAMSTYRNERIIKANATEQSLPLLQKTSTKNIMHQRSKRNLKHDTSSCESQVQRHIPEYLVSSASQWRYSRLQPIKVGKDLRSLYKEEAHDVGKPSTRGKNDNLKIGKSFNQLDAEIINIENNWVSHIQQQSFDTVKKNSHEVSDVAFFSVRNKPQTVKNKNAVSNYFETRGVFNSRPPLRQSMQATRSLRDSYDNQAVPQQQKRPQQNSWLHEASEEGMHKNKASHLSFSQHFDRSSNPVTLNGFIKQGPLVDKSNDPRIGPLLGTQKIFSDTKLKKLMSKDNLNSKSTQQEVKPDQAITIIGPQPVEAEETIVSTSRKRIDFLAFQDYRPIPSKDLQATVELPNQQRYYSNQASCEQLIAPGIEREISIKIARDSKTRFHDKQNLSSSLVPQTALRALDQEELSSESMSAEMKEFQKFGQYQNYQK